MRAAVATPEDAYELAQLRTWWATNVGTFPIVALTKMMDAAKRGDGLGARTWRERAAEWRAIATFVREITARRMDEAERGLLLRELREAKRKYDSWMPKVVTRG